MSSKYEDGLADAAGILTGTTPPHTSKINVASWTDHAHLQNPTWNTWIITAWRGVLGSGCLSSASSCKEE